jgi:hypothetical protein
MLHVWSEELRSLPPLAAIDEIEPPLDDLSIPLDLRRLAKRGDGHYDSRPGDGNQQSLNVSLQGNLRNSQYRDLLIASSGDVTMARALEQRTRNQRVLWQLLVESANRAQ